MLWSLIYNMNGHDHKYTAWKVSKYGVFYGPYFPALGLNTDCFTTILQLFYHNVEEANDIKYSQK